MTTLSSYGAAHTSKAKREHTAADYPVWCCCCTVTQVDVCHTISQGACKNASVTVEASPDVAGATAVYGSVKTHGSLTGMELPMYPQSASSCTHACSVVALQAALHLVV